jgi:fatty acid desaturase
MSKYSPLDPPEPGRIFTADEVALHNKLDDCFVVVHGKVFDVTDFLGRHPGGAQALAKEGRAGQDVTSHFVRIGHSDDAKKILSGMQIGILSDLEQGGSAHVGNADNHDEYAIAWHGTRRQQMLEAHPEIASLYGYNPGTFILGMLASALHCYCAILCKHQSGAGIFVLAYTIGAWCKMLSFMVAHEFSHGLVFPPSCITPFANQIGLHLVTLPSLGVTVYEYYAYLHLGHHAALGTAILDSGTAAGVAGIIFDHGGFAVDGDLISVNTMLLHFMPKEHACPVWAKIPCKVLLDTVTHIAHFVGMVIWSAQFYVMAAFTVLGGALFLIACVLHIPCSPCLYNSWRANQKLVAAENEKGKAETVKLNPDAAAEEAKKNAVKRNGRPEHTARERRNLFYYMATFTLHHAYMPAALFLLMKSQIEWGGSSGSSEATAAMFSLPTNGYLVPWAEVTAAQIWNMLIYLGLSELFLFGFLFHPFMGYFLGVHGSRGGSRNADDGEQMCQPTMSTYSYFASVSTGNLNLHVEHHVSASIDMRKCQYVASCSELCIITVRVRRPSHRRFLGPTHTAAD